MDFLELVRIRFSTRSFLPKMVERTKLEKCLEAARLSPSACNGQPWRFIVVESETLKGRLAGEAFNGPYKMNSFAGEAPVLVVVVTVPTKTAPRLAGLFRNLSYPLIDIGIAAEHFVLQATEEGLGTCWIGWFNERNVRKVLGLDRNERVHVILAVGYTDRETAQQKRKDRRKLEEMSEYR